MVSQKYAKFHFCPVFGLFYDFIINFIVRFTHFYYEDDAFSVKKKSNSKNFEISQMLDFRPNNSAPPIFYGNNHFDIHLITIKP